MLVDDHPVFRIGLKNLLDKIPEFQVVIDVDNPKDAWKQFQNKSIDIVITDLSFQKDSGVYLLSSIRDIGSLCPILILSMLDEIFWAERLIQEGANGYIMKDKDISTIITGVFSVLKGNVFLSSNIQQKILQGISKKLDTSMSLKSLSTREKEIFQCIGRKMKTVEIAKSLFISIKTVQTHQSNIKQKLNIHSLAGLRTLAEQYILP